MSREFDSLISLFDRRGYSQRTKEAYLHWLKRLNKFYPSTSLDELSPTEVTDFFSHLKSQQYKPESLRQAASAVKFYFKHISVRDDVEIAIPRVQRKRPLAKIPSQSDVLRTIDAIDNEQLKLLCQFIYGMGLELQEARNLKVRNVSVSDWKIEFTPQRTRQKRNVSIPLACQGAVSAQILGKDPGSYLFTLRSSGQINESTIQRAWNKARVKAKVGSHVTLRSLRHCYIRHLESLGIRIIDILHNMGINKSFALSYYAGYYGADGRIPFSPLDKTVPPSSDSDQAFIASYVSEGRISQIKSLHSHKFDFRKLAELLEELNTASRNSAHLSTAMLVRSIIDHVPPIFGCMRFHEICNNYAGSKSFKKSMENLAGALRNIADSYLHEHIRSREDIPHAQQVDFRPQVDQLLGEIIRIHSK